MLRRMSALLGLLLATGLITANAATRERVYTVPQVLAGLGRNPQAWSGRVVTVEGTALQLLPRCPSGRWCASGLYEPYTRRPGPILLLEPGPANPLVVRLRHVPLVSVVVPQPQWLRWQSPATYHVMFQTVPGTTCDGGPCINAVLVDSAVQAG
jgi:hypothetical protein